MHRRTLTTLAAAVAAAALLTACASDDAADPAADAAGDDTAAEPSDDDTTTAADDPGADGLPGVDQPATDPNTLVDDGTFRGEGVVLPLPDGWTFDPAAYAQGLVLAIGVDGRQQVAAQAVDTDLLPEPVTYEDVLEANRTQFPVEASVDEQATVEGAERAHLLRFDALPGQQEGAPDTSLLVLLADDGDGRLAVFNYAAPVDGFDDDLATTLVEGVGFDPDSDPTPPLLGNG